ncbi:hypothetical protein CF326_g6818 [Tilletia indica]|nr:hypothetical protein CF326_g6818 [Tilletia indica]
MATFKLHRDIVKPHPAEHGVETMTGETFGSVQRQVVDVWQSAIFKVGDDCRQDVLALQDDRPGPGPEPDHRPGCGAIYAVPNATSRDEMGRAKVNNLMDFFVDKYGNPDSNAFQKARLASLHDSILVLDWRPHLNASALPHLLSFCLLSAFHLSRSHKDYIAGD